MRRILIVVDMQNDFISGALGTDEAAAIVDKVVEKVKSFPSEDIIFTMDTHSLNYEETQEGHLLPIRHCIKHERGWEICDELKDIPCRRKYEKNTFGCVDLAEDLLVASLLDDIEIEIVGVCTDICVISNALLLKCVMPEVPIYVDASCCAGTTPEMHITALNVMRSCQIHIVND